jgi:Zn finger protein HypA/HybF involved in hydrogenase expression
MRLETELNEIWCEMCQINLIDPVELAEWHETEDFSWICPTCYENIYL